jgi:hypothetical protein
VGKVDSIHLEYQKCMAMDGHWVEKMAEYGHCKALLGWSHLPSIFVGGESYVEIGDGKITVQFQPG